MKYLIIDLDYASQKNILYSGGAETLRLETTGQVEFDNMVHKLLQVLLHPT